MCVMMMCAHEMNLAQWHNSICYCGNFHSYKHAQKSANKMVASIVENVFCTVYMTAWEYERN